MLKILFFFACFVACNLTCSAGVKNSLFYIYEDGFWPNISVASIYKRDLNERLENQLNHGAGPILNETAGAYHTDQYQMFSMLFYRALRDPRRTLDPAKASTFFIPYDFASDTAFYKNCKKSAGVCFDFRKCPLAPKVEELLEESRWFKRKRGKDHFLIVGMNYAMDHYILKPKCKSLLLKCTNCTKFAMDDYSYMYSGNAGILARGDNWHAAPFPSDFHWSRKVAQPYPWMNDHRPVLVSYIGSTRSFYGPAKRLRGSIVHYCNLHPVECQHSSYGLNGTRFSHKVEGHNPLQVSLQSVFCFQPIGDLMTRKGLFDSILLGCIPVVMDVLTAQVMYTWHWEEAFWNEVVVSFDFHPVAHRYFDPVKALKDLVAHNATLVRRKQQLIRERVFQLQYSLEGPDDVFLPGSRLLYTTLLRDSDLPPSTAAGVTAAAAAAAAVAVVADPNSALVDGIRYEHLNADDAKAQSLTQSQSHKSAAELWPRDSAGKPLRDAYQICMDLLLGWHDGSLIDIRNATVPECWDGKLDTAKNRCVPKD